MHLQQNAQASAQPLAHLPSARSGFAGFWQEWSEYILSLNEMDEETAEAGYLEALVKVQQLGNRTLWRGMSVNQDWLRNWSTRPVGLFWSQDAHVAQSFQQAVSVYDERFLELEASNRPNTVLLQAQVPFESIDVDATIAGQLACAEDEVRLVEGGRVRLLALHLDGVEVPTDGVLVTA